MAMGTIPDVIDGLAFERLNSASGPTTGEIRRPSDGRIPKEVVFIQCTGSRDPERYMPYCSRVCCMYTGKHARLYKHKVHDGQAYIFYMDIRSTGKGYEEFIQQGMEEEGILYLRGRVSRIFRDGDKVVVWGADTLTGKKVEISADMVVLATALIPQKDTKELARKLGIVADEYGFLTEAERKLRPVETECRRDLYCGLCPGAQRYCRCGGPCQCRSEQGPRTVCKTLRMVKELRFTGLKERLQWSLEVEETKLA